ncbi:MAG: MFS transporter [Planctomycetes bacterium]|nr:MFS transporter [Planctomycetota bacterium]
MTQPTERSNFLIWWICGLLLLASTINYMDRQTLSNTSERITREFELSEEQFGNLELAFGLAFAVGASVFGLIADRTSVKWLYPTVLLLWSAMGFATGLVETYIGLLLCRLFLGFFEAGHWPCALKTTQRLLPSSKRTLGNSVLQSGTAIGAMVTPLIIKAMLTDQRGSWRPAFQIVGLIGVVWAVLWVVSLRGQDMEATATDDAPGTEPGKLTGVDSQEGSFFDVVFSRKYLALVIVVISINLCWHQFRVWMQKFLIRGRGYEELATLDVNFWFNVMTDVGCLSAGFATALLFRRGLSAHWSRCTTFGLCSLLVASGAAIPWLPKGPALIAVLMIVGVGSLGLFPCYYAFTQELSVVHQGKVTGTLGTIAWIFPSLWHKYFGRWVDQTKSYDLGMSLVTLLPLLSILALIAIWPRNAGQATPEVAAAD